MDIVNNKAMVLIPDQKKLSIMRRYPMETMVFLLIGALAWVTWQQQMTNVKVEKNRDKIETFLNEDRSVLIKAIDNNTKVVERSNTVMEKNNALLEINLNNRKNK